MLSRILSKLMPCEYREIITIFKYCYWSLHLNIWDELEMPDSKDAKAVWHGVPKEEIEWHPTRAVYT